MAFSVVFGITNKPINSSYQFDISGGTTAQCTLKKGTSLLKPVLELQYSWEYVRDNLLRFNVAYIPDLRNRYYRVKNWVFQEPLVLCYLEVDVLATYKSELAVQGFFITRSAQAAKCNPDIVDTSVPQKCGLYQMVVDHKENPLQPPATDYGCFVVGVINSSATFGAVDYYVMSYLVFMSFISSLCNMSNMGDFTGVVDGVAKAIVNPFQYIVSARWYPYSIYDFTNRGLTGGSVGSITCGYYNVSISGSAYYFAAGLLNIEFTNVITLRIYKNPQNADGYHKFLNYAPYARYFFDFYPFGSFELDPSLLYSYSNLYVWYTVDLRSGSAICKIGPSVTGSDYTDWRMPQAWKTIEAEIGVEVPMASIQSYIPSQSQGVVMGTISAVQSFGGFGQLFKSAAASVASGIGSLAGFDEDTMNAIYENIGADPISKQDVSNIASAASQANSRAEIHGMQGAVSHYHTNEVSLMGVFYAPAAFDNASFGYPCCNRYVLGDMYGYTVCANARPVLTYATETELEEVTRLLNSGFIWE